MYSLAPPTSMLDQVYLAILDAICEGRLASGERLTQDSVADRLNVSRQPVGQAFLILKKQNFVKETGRRGLAVAPLDPNFIRSVYEFRIGIDPVAACLAAARAAPQDIDRGRRIIRTGEKGLASGSVSTLIKADMEFHMLVYQLSGNPLLAESMETHWHHLRRAMREVLKRPEYRPEVWKEHAAILDAIEAGDTKRAEKAGRRHIEAAADSLEQKVAEAISQSSD
jgi:DNA-binding GntR family transcriptional regulator